MIKRKPLYSHRVFPQIDLWDTRKKIIPLQKRFGCSTHVDNFTRAGTYEFIKETFNILGKELTILNIEEDDFRYRGTDVSTIDGGIQLEMKDYIVLRCLQSYRRFVHLDFPAIS